MTILNICLKNTRQPAGRADDDVRAVIERATLAGGVHAADAGRDARAGVAVEPHQLAADLKREFAGRGDDERERLRPGGEGAVRA